MRHFFKLSFFIPILILLFYISNAQNTNRALSVTHTQTTEKGFGNPQSISGVTDILENNEAYNALKDLIENHHITMVVPYNSVLDHIRDVINTAGLDTSLINTYDRNK